MEDTNLIKWEEDHRADLETLYREYLRNQLTPGIWIYDTKNYDDWTKQKFQEQNSN